MHCPQPSTASPLNPRPQVQNHLLELLAPHHDPERVDLPQGVLGCSAAALAFAAGAGAALSVTVAGLALVGRLAWRAWDPEL